MRAKFSLFVTALIICVAGVLGYFFFRMQKQMIYTELEERGSAIIEASANDAEYGLLTGNSEELLRLAEKILRFNDVSFCLINDIKKTISVKESRGDLDIPVEYMRLSYRDGVRTVKNNENYVFVAPVMGVLVEESSGEEDLFAFDDIGSVAGKESIVGVVTIGFSLERLRSVLRNTLYTTVLITLLIIFIAAFITMFLARVATVPILRLVDGTHRLAGGDLSIRIDSRSNDEIGDLADSFNAMAGALQKSRRELVESEEYASSIVDNMLDALFVADIDGNIESLNPAALLLLGYAHEELKGQPLANVFARRKEMLDLLTVIKEKQEINDVEVDFLSKQGEEIPVSISASTMRLTASPNDRNDSGVAQMIVVVRDMRRITTLIQDINAGKAKLEEWSKTLEQRVDERTRELLRSQETMLNIMTDLESSKAYVENIVANLMDSLVVMNMEGNIRTVNAVTLKMLGFSEDFIVGKEFTSLIDEMDLIEVIKREGQVRNIETVYKTSAKERIPILLSGAVIKDKMGTGTGVVIIAKDITEQKKAEADLRNYVQQVEEVNKELDDFTYIVSHDLKEPLRSIDAFSKFLAEDYVENLDEDGLMYVERVRSNALRMQQLIEDLLEVSRLERRQNPFAPVHIKTLIDDALLRLEYAIMEKKVEVIKSEEFPVLYCDRHRLGEVFYNLFSNAIKFMKHDHPRIEVGCIDEGEMYKFYVADNGIGIEEQYFEKIFKIFQRLGKREEYEGTGAGLTIVKKIIEMHGGKIWVESELGRGTTFLFTVPKRTIEEEQVPHRQNDTAADEEQKIQGGSSE